MLVQLLQVARGITTYESMRGYSHPHPSAGDAITSFLTTGSTSPEGGAITAAGAGPAAGNDGLGTSQPQGASHAHKHHSCWDQWKRLLGLDMFVQLAFFGSRGRQQSSMHARPQGNPFSRGILTNCKDFWCDSGPLFRSRENGMALLGGERVDYTRVYDVPARMRMRRGGGEGYQAVGTEDEV